MLKKTVLLMCLCVATVHAAPLEYYLPKGELFDAAIPTPDAIFGFGLGDQHLRHDQIVYYMGILASASPHARLIDYGQSHEGRRLVLLLISSNENLADLDALAGNDAVLKVWNGFSVHGNESSGGNASVLYAYYLLASTRAAVRERLDDTLVLIDPTINPDGFDRYATHVNAFRSATTVTDLHDASHVEHWPNGRTNHYWFDLNRDWLLLTQPESRARIQAFHRWHPHLLTDHHEMGTESTFFFQPGVADRANPLIPARNQALTAELATHHAAALDAHKQLYYTGESFDDYYPGKGSTYPDLHGSVGVLFEQARAQGGRVQTREGERSLQQGIRNQFVTALSSLNGALDMRADFLEYRRQFFDQAEQQASRGARGYLVDFNGDWRKARKLVDFLHNHRITVGLLNQDKKAGGHNYRKGAALYIPLRQRQSTLIRALFDVTTEFKDNTFYDVSAWQLPMAWGLTWQASDDAVDTLSEWQWPKARRYYADDAVAFAIDWQQGNAPAALNHLLQLDYAIKASGKPLNIQTTDGARTLAAGALIVSLNGRETNDRLFADLNTVADAHGVDFYALKGGLNNGSVDLGSPAIRRVPKARILMLTGPGINAYQAGSLWHFFDTEVRQPLVKVDLNRLGRVNLDDYTHLILPDGQYSALKEAQTQQIQSWVKSGGQLIALQRGASWVEKNLQAEKKSAAENAAKKADETDEGADASKHLPYGQFRKDLAERIIGGAIVQAEADLSHPLGFGFTQDAQFVLLRGTAVLQAASTPYGTPLRATKKPLAAGFISAEWQEKLAGKPLVVADRIGAGGVIKFAFNPTFRAYWEGTKRWLVNAVYLSHLIEHTKWPDD